MWRDALLGLALFAAVVRALVPQGFMLSAQDGGIAITICTADGARTLNGAPPGNNAGGSDEALAAAMGLCAFAGLGAIAPPPAPPIVSVAQAIELKAVALDERPLARNPHAYRPQAPRAPPTLHA
jgi:hypothetical protein